MSDHLRELMQETAKLEAELRPLVDELALDEWCEVLQLDAVAEQTRRQNMLQSHIYFARQIIANRP